MELSPVEKLRIALLAWIAARGGNNARTARNFILDEDEQIKLGDAVKIIEISIDYERLTSYIPKLVVEHYGTESILYIGCVSEGVIEELAGLVVSRILG